MSKWFCLKYFSWGERRYKHQIKSERTRGDAISVKTKKSEQWEGRESNQDLKGMCFVNCKFHCNFKFVCYSLTRRNNSFAMKNYFYCVMFSSSCQKCWKVQSKFITFVRYFKTSENIITLVNIFFLTEFQIGDENNYLPLFPSLQEKSTNKLGVVVIRYLSTVSVCDCHWSPRILPRCFYCRSTRLCLVISPFSLFIFYFLNQINCTLDLFKIVFAVHYITQYLNVLYPYRILSISVGEYLHKLTLLRGH